MKSWKSIFVCLWIPAVSAVAAEGEAAGRLVMGQGHLDIDFDYTAEAGWTLRHRHEGKGDRPLDEGLLFVRDGVFPEEGSRLVRPEDETWSFLGVEAGELFWFLPSSERTGILWPGFAAEHTESAALAPWDAGDPRRTSQPVRWIAVDLVDMRFTGEGTGHVAMWVLDSFGGPPVVFWSTAQPHPAGNRYLMSAGSHNHMAWGFSAPGVYELDVRASTVLDDGSTSESEVATLVFVVGTAPDPSRYREWAALRFPPEDRAAGRAEPGADPFGSGVANLLAFAAGEEPGASPASVTPALHIVDGQVQSDFARRGDLGGSVLRVERSADFGGWEEIARVTGTEAWTVADGEVTVAESASSSGVRMVTVSVPAAPRLFLRLTVGQEED
ncbi:MAG: choice-of-anchor M domain-containing protein [Opitutales bacterium]|nr:choice-of-anchor M domain-containing protein [Opitutales bacterium]